MKIEHYLTTERLHAKGLTDDNADADDDGQRAMTYWSVVKAGQTKTVNFVDDLNLLETSLTQTESKVCGKWPKYWAVHPFLSDDLKMSKFEKISAIKLEFSHILASY